MQESLNVMNGGKWLHWCLNLMNIVMMREEEMKAAVLRAEGESEAARLVAEAISKNGPGLIAMRKIEAA